MINQLTQQSRNGYYHAVATPTLSIPCKTETPHHVHDRCLEQLSHTTTFLPTLNIHFIGFTYCHNCYLETIILIITHNKYNPLIAYLNKGLEDKPTNNYHSQKPQSYPQTIMGTQKLTTPQNQHQKHHGIYTQKCH